MSVERRDPLPPGRYSIFILPNETSEWQAWTAAHRATVRVNATVDQKAVGGTESTAIFHVDTDGRPITESKGAAIFFTVSAPTPWVGLGLPTIEKDGLDAWKKDVTENPDPGADVLDQVRNLILFGGLVYLGAAYFRGRRK